jgi:hypothetical protein
MPKPSKPELHVRPLDRGEWVVMRPSIATRVFPSKQAAQDFADRLSSFWGQFVEGYVLRPLRVLQPAPDNRPEMYVLCRGPLVTIFANITDARAAEFAAENADFLPELSFHKAKQRSFTHGGFLFSWSDLGGRSHAEMALAKTEMVTTALLRISYAMPAEYGGHQYQWGVEQVIIDSSGTVNQVATRALFKSDGEASEYFRKCCGDFEAGVKNLPAPKGNELAHLCIPLNDVTEIHLPQLPPDPTTPLSLAIDAGKKALRDGARDHKLLAARRKAGPALKPADTTAVDSSQWAAQEGLLRERYPNIYRLRDQAKLTGSSPIPALTDEMRKAISLDWILNESPIPEGLLSGIADDLQLERDQKKALHLANPRKPVDWELALNWRTYRDMRAAEYTPLINKVTGANLSVGAMKRRVSRLDLHSGHGPGRPKKR